MPGEVNRPEISNVLASRYASVPMLRNFSEEGKVIHGRQLWVEVMEGQAALGANIPPEAIAAYRAVIDQVDLTAIQDRERKLRHDEWRGSRYLMNWQDMNMLIKQ